jgi:O-antigen/teichoic acid export membrane protein
MIIANTNEFFITNLYGANYTMEYTFYYKISTIGIMIISLALTPVWSAVTKAQAEKNWEWLRKLYRYIKVGGIGILILQLLIVPIIPIFMDVWLGKGVIEVSYLTSLSFSLYGAIFTYAGMLSTIANGLAQMRAQTISYAIAIVLKILLIIFLAPVTSWDFVIWVNILILLPYIVIQQRSLNKYMINHLG